MGCRFAGWPADAFEAEEAQPRSSRLRPRESLLASSGEPRLEATLIGIRPARHVLLWEGYFRAAEALIDICKDEPREALRLVYPILFSYRHAVELSLKFFIDFYGNEDPPRSHDLMALWAAARELIDGHSCAAPDELESMGTVVSELHGLDPASTSFRYSWRRRHLADEELLEADYPHDRDDVNVDLIQIADVMERVKQFLDEIDFDLMGTVSGPLE